ncbi:DUF637 domain-containing protein [Microbulbifer sp. ANSA001]|uniref:DUF637 domain-containing protein n=1 Tax=Microbulbifer sp. ANSA001 TaxID=3243358 RepID=UPI004042AC6C
MIMNTEKKTERSSYTKWQRLIASVVTFFFSMQLCMPAMAGVAGIIESALIEAELNANHLFQRENNNEYQFKSADYLDTNAHQTDVNIESFFKRLKESSKENLPAPLMIPIGVGDITVILPHYPLIKRVGTNFVQSRYIRSQVYAQLGRNLINTQVYGTEREQISKLYDNAYNYALVSGKIFGEPLGLSASQITTDMIWPEVRYINGENVLVPILYLKSSTIDAQKVTGDENEFGGSLVELGGLQIDNTDVTLRRASFLKIAENLVNNQGNLIAEDDLKIVAGGSLQNISGLISSEGDLLIGAHSIENRTIVHRYNLGQFQSERFGPIAEINAEGDIYFKTSSDIILQGSVVSAGESIRFEAGGDIYIGSQQITNRREGSSGGISYRSSSIAHLASKLSASDTIALIAQGNILIDASEIISDSGHIEILSGLGITIEDNLNVRESYRKGKYGKRKIEESIYQTVAIRSLLDAGEGIRLHSEYGDITLRAADISSEDGTKIQAKNGGVNLLMTTETDQYSYTSIKKGLFTVSVKSEGHVIEKAVTNSIVGGLAVKAFSTVNVEYEGDRSLSMDEQIAQLSKMEGLEWMGYVRSEFPNADWTAIELQYEEWNESSTSISPAFAAVISIAMAIASGGSSLTASSWMQAAVAAGTATLETQLVIALANGIVDGDIAGSMENLASSETFKGLAVAMVTAGVLHQVDTTFFGADTNAINKGKEAFDAAIAINPSDIAAADKAFQAAFDAAAAQSVLSPLQQVSQAVTHAAVRAGIQTGVYDSDFEDTFTQSLMQNGINRLGAHMAKKIGQAWDPKDTNTEISNWDTAMKYIAHAGSGCVIGVLTAENSGQQNASDGCVSGGAGAVIGEFTATVYRERTKPQVDKANTAINNLFKKYGDDVADYESRGYSREQIADIFRYEYGLGAIEQQITELKEQGVDLARFSAGLSVFLAGAEAAGVNTAADVGAITAENNALFIFLIPVILKAIDLALLGVDLYPIYEAYRDGGVDAGNQALADYIIVNGTTNLVLTLFPGGKIGNKLISKMDENELFQAIKAWGEQLGNVAKETGDAFLTLLGEKSELALEGLKGYILRRELRDDKEGLELNGGKVDTEKYLDGLTDFYERKGDLYISKKGEGVAYRDTGVLEDGKPVLQSEKGSYYFYVDENGVQVPTSSPFAANVDKYRIFHNKQVDAIFIEYGKIPNIKVQKEVTVQYDNEGHEYHGMIARADLSVTGGGRDGAIDVPDDFELYDLNGNHIPGGKIQLDSEGRALLEVKTGNATLTSNQKVVYDACTSGQASACGANADEGGFRGQMDEIFVYILRSTKSPHD